MLQMVSDKKEKVKEILSKLDAVTAVELYNRYVLNSSGVCTFRKGDYFEMNKSNRVEASCGVIEQALTGKTIAVSDFFIAYAVGKLGCADRIAIANYLDWLSKNNPDKCIPGNLSEDSLVKRLTVLSRCGVLRKMHMMDGDGKLRLAFYCITSAGAEAAKRVLDLISYRYDGSILLSGANKICKRIAVGKVLSKLILSPAKLDIEVSAQTYDKNLGGKYDLYAQVVAKSEDKKTLIVIEPISFGVETSIKTTDEVLQDIKQRINLLSRRVSSIINEASDKKSYDDVRVMFLIDDYASLLKVVEMVVEDSIALAEHSYFTSERLVAANDNYLSRSFYKVVYMQEDGVSKPKVVLERDNEALFGSDDGESLKIKEEHIEAMGYV